MLHYPFQNFKVPKSRKMLNFSEIDCELIFFQSQEYIFRLHEDADYGWQPRLSAREFMRILSNLTSIKIRGTYTTDGKNFF